MNDITACPITRSPNVVTLQMGHLARLSLRETQILQDLPQLARHYPAHTELCVEGLVQSPRLLLSGWACYQRTLRDGRRQIVRLIVPGDAIGSLVHPSIPHKTAVLALTQVVVADAQPLLNATDEAGGPLLGFTESIAATAHLEEASLYDQIVRLGRQTAYERLVHLFVESHDRLKPVGLVESGGFLVPLTQEILADALGLSCVHLNRTLQQVRRDRLLEFRGGRVTLLHVDTMRDMVDAPRSYDRAWVMAD